MTMGNPWWGGAGSQMGMGMGPMGSNMGSGMGSMRGPWMGSGMGQMGGPWMGGPWMGAGMGPWMGYGMGPMGMGFGGQFGGYPYGGFGGQFGPGMTWGGTYAPAMAVTSVPTTGPMGGLGGLRRWGGSYSAQYDTTGLPTDEEIEEMIYDAMDNDPLIPYETNIDVTSDAGTVTLTGSVPDKMMKHAAGQDAWWITGVVDVNNQITVTGQHKVSKARARHQQGQAGQQQTQSGGQQTQGQRQMGNG